MPGLTTSLAQPALSALDRAGEPAHQMPLRYTLTGQRREVGFGRALHPDITLLPAD